MLYDQLLFSELRLVSVSMNAVPLCEENILRAMTTNEELLALGYTLAPKDIVTLAKSADLTDFAARVRSYLGDVKAKPMYPDFPSQVMEMDEAVFRFHQMIHYLSTYGIEEITGMSVTRGWLPEMQETEKTEPDDKLLAAKTIALIGSDEKYTAPFRRILTKTERMNNKECMMIAECAKHLTAEEMAGVRVTFKQNLLIVFHTVFADEALSSAEKAAFLRAVCQHTGDVWKCLDYTLTRSHFHLRTAQKRLTVKLLESFPLWDFRSNLILSGKKRERTLLMLKFIDFNEYSRKSDYAKAVADLRAGKLRSWESEVKEMVSRKAPEALDAYAERPGMMLRHLTYLLRNGYAIKDLFDKLLPHAPELSPQTLTSLAAFFSRPEINTLDEMRYQESVRLKLMVQHLLQTRLAANETVLRGKKIYLDMPQFDLDLSALRIADKSDEGGYIRSGLAYKIPEDVTCIRFFVYWNDSERVDVDLHGAATGINGEKINIGWNACFKSGELVFSGDITHSDAAEYMDLDLVKAKETLRCVTLNIHLFSGYNTFGEIDECFVGIMGVSKTGTEIKLYDPKNCFFTHYLKGKSQMLNYGFIDVQNRVLVFDGTQNNQRNYYAEAVRNNSFSLRNYLDILFTSQNAALTDSPDDADIVLVMGKPASDKEVSLIDHNFFLEA
ncbi:MAG: hypothetical protein IJL32_09915 [Oscillospiraceae bacterium]|nr:hypothetical protein [Oscillospiraceae bacterium]